MSFKDYVQAENKLNAELNQSVCVEQCSDPDPHILGYWGVRDLPYEGAHRRQFMMGNKEDAGFRDAQIQLGRVVETKIIFQDSKTRNRQPPYGSHFEFYWRGQTIDGVLNIRFHRGTGLQVDLYSEREIPQDLTDKIWNYFHVWSKN
jgi:hypothetical protein